MPKTATRDPVSSPGARELLACFQPSLFLPHLRSTTKAAALAEMADALVEQGLVRDRDVLLEMLAQRESLGSTGIGKGVAVPHGRSLAARELVVVVGRSVEGLDYAAIDGKPVHHLFLIVAPPQDSGPRYLAVLGRLVDLVKDAASRKQLLKAETYDDFLAVVDGHRFDG